MTSTAHAPPTRSAGRGPGSGLPTGPGSIPISSTTGFPPLAEPGRTAVTTALETLSNPAAEPTLPVDASRTNEDAGAPYFAISPHVRAAGSDDGIALLDLRSGKYLSLDPVGARIWQQLAEGRSKAEITEHLRSLFDAPAEQIRNDVSAMLRRFTDVGLLEPMPSRPDPWHEITPSKPGKHPAAFPTVRYQAESGPSGSRIHRWLGDALWLVRGLLALGYIDLLTRLRAFPGVHRALERARANDPQPLSPLAWQITAAVNRAAALYYQRRWCLQRSAACAYLLRRHGFGAELVLGVQVLPFIAHAWVEMDGKVINDNPELTRTFAELHRV